MNKLLSIIIPAYNESASIHHAIDEIRKALGEINYEILFIDDGSKDDTAEQIKLACSKHSNVIGLILSRNFGKESAISAGLGQATGDCCVVMDCDMQHPPEKIVEMYKLWQAGYKVIEGVKSHRGKEGYLHNKLSQIFYKLMSGSSGMDMKDSSDFKLIDRTVVDVINSMPEKSLFFRGLTFWVGFKNTKVSYEVNERLYGETKWSKISLWKYAFKNISSFSSAPMQLVTIIGVLTLIASSILSVHTVYNYAIGNALEGFSTVILVMLIIGSMIMISLGIIGYYIAKIYEEIKGRPTFIIEEVIDPENQETA